MKRLFGYWLIALFFLLPQQGNAFIPPVSGILQEIFESRKSGKPTETVLRHRISPRPGEVIEIEERIVADRNRYWFLWKTSGGLASGNLEGRNYFLPGRKAVPSRSGLFLRYVAGSSADDFRDQLVSEGFVRRDQLLQYKPNFEPTGDPRAWPLKDNYLIHPDVSLIRVLNRVGIQVVGSDDASNRKSVVFDQGLKGVLLWEWKDSQRVASWGFEGFSPVSGDGIYPRIMTFQMDAGQGPVKISSDWVARRVLNSKQLTDFQNTYRQANKEGTLTGPNESALQLLLSYR